MIEKKKIKVKISILTLKLKVQAADKNTALYNHSCYIFLYDYTQIFKYHHTNYAINLLGKFSNKERIKFPCEAI